MKSQQDLITKTKVCTRSTLSQKNDEEKRKENNEVDEKF